VSLATSTGITSQPRRNARDLRRQGVDADAAALEALPHDVELSERALARIGGGI